MESESSPGQTESLRTTFFTTASIHCPLPVQIQECHLAPASEAHLDSLQYGDLHDKGEIDRSSFTVCPGLLFEVTYRMKTSDKSSRIDLGRLAAVAIFAFFMVISILAVQKDLKAFFPLDAVKCLLLAHRLLVAAFYVLVIALYFVRDTASATTRSFPARLIAVTASFLPFLIPVLGDPAGAGHFPRPAILAISNVIILSGMAFAMAALGTLGKSFSIIPQARKLVVRGPYRLVRHPIYIGEITSMLGLTLAGVSIPKILVFLLLVGCQVYRALQEEKLLTTAFPEYADYAAKTARFLPGLF